MLFVVARCLLRVVCCLVFLCVLFVLSCLPIVGNVLLALEMWLFVVSYINW